MKTAIRVFGLIWALVGIANLAMSDVWFGGSTMMILLVILFNAFIFILPGLFLAK